MSEQERYWMQLDEEYYQLMCKKNQDYSQSNIVYSGVPGVLIRIWDKMCRLFSLFNVQIPNYLTIFDNNKAEMKLVLADMLNKRANAPYVGNIDMNHKIQKDMEQYIDFVFERMEKACQVDFSKFKEVSPQNESVLDTFKDLEIYTRIGHLRYLGKWGR